MRAFWGASAVVPLCIPQAASAVSHRLRREYRELVVWWGTPVEVRSAIGIVDWTLDVNRDRVLDVVIGYSEEINNVLQGGQIFVVLGTADGGFPTPKRFFIRYRPRTVAVADLNRDGNMDIVTTAEVLFGLGNGDFQTAQTLPNLGAAWTAVADLNRDGAPDIISIGPRGGLAMTVPMQ